MRRRRLAYAAAAIALLCGAPASAETLPEAISAALASSPALGSERARLAAVREALPLAWAEALPQINADASANTVNRSEPIFSPNVREQPEYWIATVRTSTLLFGSGRILASTRQARGRIASAVALYQNAAETIALEVTRAYGDVREAQAILAAQTEGVANLEEQLRFVTANVDRGFLTQTDLAQARARVAQSRAELSQANARLVAASEAYQRLVGHPPSGLEAPGPLLGLPADLESAIEIAGRENPRIVSALADVQTSEASVDLAGAQGRARITIDTSNSEFGVIDRPGRENDDENSASLRVSMPIFNGGAIRARSRQQRALRQAANYDLAEAQRRARESVIVAWSDLNAARARLDSQTARVEAAELARRGIRREQDFGQRTTIDVLNQEQELLSARSDLARAERGAMVSERDLAAAIGRLIAMTQESAAATPAQPQPETRTEAPRIRFAAPRVIEAPATLQTASLGVITAAPADMLQAEGDGARSFVSDDDVQPVESDIERAIGRIHADTANDAGERRACPSEHDAIAKRADARRLDHGVDVLDEDKGVSRCAELARQSVGPALFTSDLRLEVEERQKRDAEDRDGDERLDRAQPALAITPDHAKAAPTSAAAAVADARPTPNGAPSSLGIRHKT